MNRQYSPSVERFNRVDPLASSGKEASPQSWNRYAYATSDPINMKDPLGLFEAGSGYTPPLNPCAYGGATIIVDGLTFDPNLMCVEFSEPILQSPEPEPISCTIAVFDRLIESVHGIPIPGARHGYIVFIDRDGRVFFFEGWQVGEYLRATDTSRAPDTQLAGDNPKEDRLDGPISGPDFCDWLDILQHDVDVVNAADINYHWWGPNNSSVLRYMLESLPNRSWFRMPFMIGYGSRLPGVEPRRNK